MENEEVMEIVASDDLFCLLYDVAILSGDELGGNRRFHDGCQDILEVGVVFSVVFDKNAD